MNVIEEFQQDLIQIESKLNSALKSKESLDELTNQVNQLEFSFEDYENYLLKELELLEASFEQMRKGLKAQNNKLERILKAIPADVLEEASTKAEPNSMDKKMNSQKSSSNSNSRLKSIQNPKIDTAKDGSTKVSKQPPVPLSQRTTSPNQTKLNDKNGKNQEETKKPVFKTSIDFITKEEFSRIPTYVVGRNTIEKVNGVVADLNVLLQDKLNILGIPEHKLIKQQDRDLVYSFKQLQTKETKGYFFVTEKELKDKQGWTNSKFVFSAAGRNVLTILRTLGRLKEVRGGQATRYVLI